VIPEHSRGPLDRLYAAVTDAGTITRTPPRDDRRRTATMTSLVPPTGVSGHADPAGEAPWAMQLVVRAEKTAPPTRTDACAAAALAVVALLSDERATCGEWRPAVTRWQDGRIRKHCRRARGAAWDRAEQLPGVTVTSGTAQVRAFVPGPTDAIADTLRKLQLSGSELPDPDPVVRGPVDDPDLVVISLTPDPHLPFGKAAAAAGHGAQLAWLYMDPVRRADWAAAGFGLVIEQPDLDFWAWRRRTARRVCLDAGFTVVAPGTATCVTSWV